MEIKFGDEAPGWLDHMFICTTCGGLHSDPAGSAWPHATPQRCYCEIEQIQRDERWPGSDLNKMAELCYCCGQVLLASGSRFSVWFCGACKEEVGLLNGRLGRYAVPIGRHSLHAGWMLKPSGPDDQVWIEDLCNSWNAAAQAMERLAEWARVVVLRIAAERFGSGADRIPVRGYLEYAAASEIEKMHYFRNMMRCMRQSSGFRQGVGPVRRARGAI